MQKTKRKPGIFILLCSLAYFASYITRLDYATILVELINDLGTTKQVASIGVTGSFITYGLGMFLSGYLGDKMHPRLLIAIGLLGSSLINLLAGTLNSIYLIAGLWCFNGLFQAMLYPPLMRLMGDNLSSDDLVTGITSVNIAANVATVLLYLISPLLITLSGWRLVFWMATAVGVLVAVLFLLGTRNTEHLEAAQSMEIRQSAPIGKIIAKAGLVPILFAIIIVGILRDGIQTWMPNYVSEILRFPSEYSILLSVMMPIFSIISISLTKVLYGRLHNALKAAFTVFAISSLSALILTFTFRSVPVLGAVIVALINACMHGTNFLLISILPAYFKKYGKISTFSGMLNAFVYVGAAISTYGIAVISENFGWLTTIVCWVVLAFAGMLICLLRTKRWQRFTSEE